MGCLGWTQCSRACVTAMSAANTYVSAIEAVREDQQGHGSANDMGMDVIALQDLPQHTV